VLGFLADALKAEKRLIQGGLKDQEQATRA